MSACVFSWDTNTRVPFWALRRLMLCNQADGSGGEFSAEKSRAQRKKILFGGMVKAKTAIMSSMSFCYNVIISWHMTFERQHL